VGGEARERLRRAWERQTGGRQGGWGWRRPRRVSRALPGFSGGSEKGRRRQRMRLCGWQVERRRADADDADAAEADADADAEAQMRCWLRARQRRSIQVAMVMVAEEDDDGVNKRKGEYFAGCVLAINQC